MALLDIMMRVAQNWRKLCSCHVKQRDGFVSHCYIGGIVLISGLVYKTTVKCSCVTKSKSGTEAKKGLNSLKMENFNPAVSGFHSEKVNLHIIKLLSETI